MITTEVVGVDQLRRKLNDIGRVFPSAASRAINRAASTMRSKSVKSIAKRMGLKQKIVRDRARVKRSTPRKLVATVKYVGRHMNLIRFKARQKKEGVSAAPWGQRRTFPQTFLVDLGRGQFVGVRKRRTGNQAAEHVEDLVRTRRVGRTPVVSVVGPGVATTAAEPKQVELRRTVVREVMATRLRHELDRVVKRRASR